MRNLAECYRILELEPGASLDEINQSYKDLVFIWHPDRIPDDNARLQEKAAEKIKALNKARDRLREHQATRTSTQKTTSWKPVAKPQEQQPYAKTYGTRTYTYRAASRVAHAYAFKQPNYRKAEPTPASTEAKTTQTAASNNGSSSRYSYSATANRSTTQQRPSPDFRSFRTPPRAAPRPEQAAPQPIRYHGPDLTGHDFSGANLSEKDFSRHNLSQANLSRADLSDAFLHQVNLAEANLQNANLFRANLLKANLSKANLRGANLVGADFSGANLAGADLSGARVGTGDRWMVKLTGAVLAGAVLPDGRVHQ